MLKSFIGKLKKTMKLKNQRKATLTQPLHICNSTTFPPTERMPMIQTKALRSGLAISSYLEENNVSCIPLLFNGHSSLQSSQSSRPSNVC